MGKETDKKDIEHTWRYQLMYSGPNYYSKNEANILNTVAELIQPRWRSFRLAFSTPKENNARIFINEVIKRCAKFGVEPLYESGNYIHFSSGSILLTWIPSKFYESKEAKK